MFLGAEDSVLCDRCSIGRCHTCFDQISKYVGSALLGGWSSVRRSGTRASKPPESSTMKMLATVRKVVAVVVEKMCL